MRKYLLFLVTLFQATLLLAQAQGKISLTIRNEQQQPVENATVELLRAGDSVLYKTALPDKNGLVVFEGLVWGDYLVRATGSGLATSYSKPFTLNASSTSITIGDLVMKAGKNTQMETVVVSTRKPFIQKLADRVVVNVESSILSAGSSVLDILERSPGVTVDGNDVLSLRGRSGVIIMIDGKPTAMSGQDLMNYLRSLPSNAVERIDIITNPSAKYDAAGNSGIIDIRMKKDQRLGTNGTATVGYGQGVYPKANAGATLNYRNKKMNLFGNYNYVYRKGLNHLVINRNFYDNGVFIGSDDKDNYAVMPLHSNNARIGADFFPSEKTIIGFVLNGSFTRFSRRADIQTTVNDPGGQPDYRFLSLGTNKDRFENAVGNINFKHRFDSTGKELNADIDYGVFSSASLTRTSSSFYEMNGTVKSPDEILDGDQQGQLHFKTAKADYVHPLGKQGKFETGVKASYVYSDNDAKFYNVFPSYTQVDSGKTNRFFYKEYNYAAYLNFSREYKKFNYQLGLRGEQTLNRTRQVQGDKRNTNDYFRLFPSAFVNYNLKENQTVGLSVSRRIDRPGYNQLNPFLAQIDPTIYGTGNPFLLPQMTWSYEMSYTIKSMHFTLGYSHTSDVQTTVLARIRDIFPDFVIQPGQSENITVQIPVNLSSSDYVGLTATVPLRISKWWNTISNFNFYYNDFNGNLGNVPLNDGTAAASLRTNNSFSLKKGWSAELNAQYNTGGRSGYMVMKAQWALSAGAQKQIMKGKGTIRFNMSDIFWTNLPNAKVVYEGRYVENWHAYRETRVANLSFTYRFGNNKVQQARKRSTASEEERQRAGGS